MTQLLTIAVESTQSTHISRESSESQFACSFEIRFHGTQTVCHSRRLVSSLVNRSAVSSGTISSKCVYPDPKHFLHLLRSCRMLDLSNFEASHGSRPMGLFLTCHRQKIPKLWAGFFQSGHRFHKNVATPVFPGESDLETFQAPTD